MPYVKLDSNILDSTLWLCNADVCKVFITMLAMAKPDGMVEATAPGISRRANLELGDTKAALHVLSSPDEDSRSMGEEGRRIRRVEGGFVIINYLKYRDKDHTNAARQRRFRERNRNAVTPLPVTEEEAEAKEEGHIGDDDSSHPPCPHNEIVKLYHELLPSLRRVSEWTKERQTLLRARWRENPGRQNLDWWKKYFLRVAASDFLMGRAPPTPGHTTFEADLEWLVRPRNLIKVLEGKYDTRRKPSGPTGAVL